MRAEDREQARCAGNSGPFDAKDPTEALALCAGCPVTTACLAFGTATHGWGVWGAVVLENGRRLGEVTQPAHTFTALRPEFADQGRCIVCGEPAPPRNRYCSSRCTLRAAALRRREAGMQVA